jgi:hypothetical protein
MGINPSSFVTRQSTLAICGPVNQSISRSINTGRLAAVTASGGDVTWIAPFAVRSKQHAGFSLRRPFSRVFHPCEICLILH